MKKPNLQAIAYLLLPIVLSACSDTTAKVGNAIDDVVETASGRITEVKYRANEAIKPVKETIEEVQQRVDSVQKGVEKLNEGKALIEEGVR